MAEPHAVVVGAITGAAASAPMFFLGAHVDALIVGLTAAVLVSLWLPSVDTKMKAFAAVSLSALLAGYGSPVVAAYGASWFAGANPESTRLLMALLIGIVSPVGVPVALRLVPGLMGRFLGADK